MTLKHEVTSDFIIEAIETFFDMRVEKNPDWINEARLSLRDELIQLFEFSGIGQNTPSIIVDNFLINGDFVDREDWENEHVFSIDAEMEEHEIIALKNQSWLDYCSENAIIYNDEYACLQF